MTKTLQKKILRSMGKRFYHKRYNTDRKIISLRTELNKGDYYNIFITYEATSNIFYPNLSEVQEQYLLNSGGDITLQNTIKHHKGDIFQLDLGPFQLPKEIIDFI
ncbi:MAG: hypothetical protein R6U15_08175 [Candidatus Izemoplasmatales bacterium]